MVSTVSTAKQQVIPLILEDLQRQNKSFLLDSKSPDGDPGKFLLDGKIARVIHRRDGFYAKINLDWFNKSFVPPTVNGTSFYWYVFALAPSGQNSAISYFICSYRQMIELVLDFDAPLGNDHRDHDSWNGRFIFIDEDKNMGYFAWRDENPDERKPHRFFQLRNAGQVFDEDTLSGLDSEAVSDILIFKETYDHLPETERQAIVKSRIGQGIFRDNLIKFWNGCSITGLTNPEYLVASHIKPWRDSTNTERLDKYNGLLLIPNLDYLFDKGFISFTDSGSIKISSHLKDNEIKLLSLDMNLRLQKVVDQHKGYLHYHRAQVFKT